MELQRALLAALCLGTFLGNSVAANIEYVRTSEAYYILTPAGSSRIVRVAAIDQKSGFVKVIDENGVADWVKPEVLLTRTQVESAAKRARDAEARAQDEQDAAEVAGAALGIGILVCMFSPDSCKDKPSGNKGYAFHITNSCSHPINLAVSYRDVTGEWINRGWYSFEPNERSYLSDDKGRNILTNNATWYYYAKSADSSNIEWSGKDVLAFGAQRLPMKRVDQASGENQLRLTCE